MSLAWGRSRGGADGEQPGAPGSLPWLGVIASRILPPAQLDGPTENFKVPADSNSAARRRRECGA